MRRLRIAGFLVAALIPLTLIVWWLPPVNGWLQPAAELPTQVPTAVPLAVMTASPTFAPTTAPTGTAEPTAIPTQPPSPTATATATTMVLPATNTPQPTVEPTVPPTVTATATETAVAIPSSTTTIGEPCPNPSPLKPEYATYVLGESWPTPSPSPTTNRIWLAKPLPGGGRYLINQTFPYGTDGSGRYLLHNGVDTAGSLETPVLAVADGTVIVAQSDANRSFGWRCDWYGHAVMVELDVTWLGQPVYAFYGHVLNIQVEPGQRVTTGQPVAYVGVGGAASVAHLHFEIRVGGTAASDTRNPMLWVSPGETRGVIAGRVVDGLERPWQGVGVTLIPQTDNPEFMNTWSYMADPLGIVGPNPDELLAENFVFNDVLPGDYIVYTKINGLEYRVAVTVQAGEISVVEIVTGE